LQSEKYGIEFVHKILAKLQKEQNNWIFQRTELAAVPQKYPSHVVEKRRAASRKLAARHFFIPLLIKAASRSSLLPVPSLLCFDLP
jgi:hypothetical protein